jgi:undecaprenyl-diphosphatase
VHHLSYFRAIVIGLFQGVTELFPVSSLGHSVLIAALLGWTDLVKAQSGDSFFLAFLVALHVGTALALFVYFWRDWFEIIGDLVRSLRQRRVVSPAARLGLLLIVATIPAGLVGVLFEQALRDVFAKPFAAAAFLTLNGLILLAGERLRRRPRVRALAAGDPQHENPEPGRRLESLSFGEAIFVGVTQIGALFAGISRSGVTMVAGLTRGLDHEDAARFAFLLATPIIAAAGVYKLPTLFGHLGDGVRMQSLVGAIFAMAGAYVSTRFLVKFFKSQTLWPFGVYCLVAGIACMIRFA